MLCYLLFRSGPATETGMEAVAFARSGLEQPDLAIQYHFAMLIYGKNGNEIDKRHGFMAIFHVCYPKCHGTFSLKFADPALPPAIDPNYLADDADLAVLREGLRISRKIIAQRTFDPQLGNALISRAILLLPDRQIFWCSCR
jgi:choline dehydrogenase